MTDEIANVDPKTLKNYPLNQKIYGDHIDENYLNQVEKDKRIKDPITVCRSSLPNLDGHIVKGRRRRMAAIMKRFETVPVRYWDCEDVLEFEYEMITDNIRNDITIEEKVRMYDELKRIESEKSKKRQLSGNPVNTSQVGRNSAQPVIRSPKASEIAAKTVGLTRDTAEKASRVVHEADRLKQNGDVQAAAKLRETLNTKSVNAAAQLVAKPKKTTVESQPTPAIPERLQPVFALIEQFKAFDKVFCPKTQDLASEAASILFSGSTKHDQDAKLVSNLMGKIHAIIMPWQPDRVCDCKAENKGCKRCKGRGWLPKSGQQR